MFFFIKRYLSKISPRITIEIYGKLTAFISFPLIVSILSNEDYGYFAYCIFFIYIIETVAKWGFAPQMVEDLYSKFKSNALDYYIISLIFNIISVFIFFLILIFFIQNYIFDQNFIILFLVFFNSIIIIFNVNNFIQALDLTHKILIPSILFRSLYLFSLFYFQKYIDLQLLLILYVIPYIIINIYGHFLIVQFIKLKKILKYKFIFENIFGYIKYSFNTFLNIILLRYHFFIIIIILSINATIEEIAIYTFLFQLYRPGLTLIELIMRLFRQTNLIIKNNSIKYDILLSISLILFFLIIFSFGFELYEYVFQKSEFIIYWKLVKIILITLCIDVLFIYLNFVNFPHYFGNLKKIDSISIMSFSLLIYPITIIFFNYSLEYLLYSILIMKILQVAFISIYAKLKLKK